MDDLHFIKQSHNGAILIHYIPTTKELDNHYRLVRKALIKFFSGDNDVIYLTDDHRNQHAVDMTDIHKYISLDRKILLVVSDLSSQRIVNLDFLGKMYELLKMPKITILWFCDWTCFYEPLKLVSLAENAFYLRFGDKMVTSLLDDHFALKIWNPANANDLTYENYIEGMTKTAIISYDLKSHVVSSYCPSTLLI